MSSTISRVMSWMIIYLDHMLPCGSSTAIASTTRPTLKHGGQPYRFMFGLASSGVYIAPTVTSKAVVS